MSLEETEVCPVRPGEVGGMDGEEELPEIQLDLEIEESEAREPCILRDPGAPTESEVEHHNVTHLPFRAWCPACVEGKARDRPHKRQEDENEKRLPEVVFDYGFMGTEGEDTIAIQVARDRRTRMVFAHVVPKKGFTHEHGAAEMVKDIKKLGYSEMILKCDGEPALKSVQEEVKRRRSEQTILENSPVGDSRSNGVAERAVQAIGEHVRVLRRGLEQRLGVKLSSKHPVTAWLVEHAADLLSRFHIGDDGRTGYERLKGKRCKEEMAEFGEKVHYRYNPKAKTKDDKMEARWGEGFYLGRWWRTGEAIIGTHEGVRRAGTIRRVGGHRRWDRGGLERVRGVPWQWDPDQEDVHVDLKVRWLKEEEIAAGNAGLNQESTSKRMYRLRLRKEDFVRHGFTEGCLGCQALIAGTGARGHSEQCRDRMNEALEETEEGRQRRERQGEKENEYLARELEKFDEDQRAKKARLSKDVPSSTSASSSSGLKRDGSEQDDARKEKVRREEEPRGHKREMEKDEEEMEVSLMERTMQEDMKWGDKILSDMCEPDNEDLRRAETDLKYYDENTWEELDTEKVMEAERVELERFTKMGVYDYVSREEAMADPDGKFVKVKWVRTNKGTPKEQEVKCRLVAQELGYGQRMDELFAGTPSLMAVKLALAHAAKGGPQHRIMVLDVKSAFLYGEMRRKVYIELPRQDPRWKEGRVVGVLRKALYGTRDAPQIWGGEVKKTLESMGFSASVHQPSVFHHKARGMVVVVHVDDFLCSGEEKDLEWLYDTLRQKYDLKKSVLESSSDDIMVRYLNRTIRWTTEGLELEGDEKHEEMLKKEWGMEHCKEVETPITKGFQEQSTIGEELREDEAKQVRRAIARINYMAQDRPDLSVAARVLSQCMAHPREGVRQGVKRVIRYLSGRPRCVLMIPHSVEFNKIEVMTDSDWAGDISTRRSCSGGSLQFGGATVLHWSKLQSNVALSSGEAELNAAVKGMSEAIGLSELVHEIFQVRPGIKLTVDASACKGMLLRQGAGRVKHLTTKQLWVQGAIQSYGVEVSRTPREFNSADALTHPTSSAEMDLALDRMGFKVQPHRLRRP